MNDYFRRSVIYSFGFLAGIWMGYSIGASGTPSRLGIAVSLSAVMVAVSILGALIQSRVRKN